VSRPAPVRYGGQALVEGVMIRGRTSWAVAIRHPDGSIVGETGTIAAPAGWQTRPFLRGIAVLATQFRLGWRLMALSAGLKAFGDRRPTPRRVAITSWTIALVVTIGLFIALPLFATERSSDSGPLIRLAEGAIKFALLVGYLALIRRMASIGRLFAYHGAEHMAVHAREAARPLTVAEASAFPPAHPRCGTAFLVILALIDTLILALLPRFGTVPDLALRLFGLPLLAGVAYEVLRFGANREGLMSVLNRIGIATQRLTTAQPDEAQLEVALAALQLCLAAEGEPLPEGSTLIAVQPIPDYRPSGVPAAA
jgi:uncharacterized protein YqhQ